MRTIICGSRSYAKQKPDEELDAYLQRVRLNKTIITRELGNFVDSTTAVLSGDAKGPDKWGATWGSAYGIKVEVYPANWKLFGNGAGFKRNLDMLQNADRVIAFYDGFSRGTSHTVRMAREMGLELHEFIGILKS